ncbi:MAG: SIS domain-containing protein [Clostridia bacterium]|nr:SIS domain-containing protein [Clostridia bacterium]
MYAYPALEEMTARSPALVKTVDAVSAAIDCVIRCYRGGGKLLICGNGGSCADSEHIVGELLKGFNKKRPLPPELCEKIDAAAPGMRESNAAHRLQLGLPAVSLTSQGAILTAAANDLGPDLIYAQQVLGLGKSGDVLIGISTSGNADNVCKAAAVAKVTGMKTIAFTGQTGGRLAPMCDIALRAPTDTTPLVQEYHMILYHTLCDAVESWFFSK